MSQPRAPHLPNLLGDIAPASQPKQARSRAKREALLVAARALLLERGYEQTSIADIAARAEIAVGGFYQHFSDKRQLALTLMQHFLEAIDAFATQNTGAPPASPREAIALLVEQGLAVDWENAGVVRAWRELANRDPALRAFDTEINRWSAYRLEQLLLPLTRHPNARTDIDVPEVAALLNLMFWRLIELPPASAAQGRATQAALTHMIYHTLLRA